MSKTIIIKGETMSASKCGTARRRMSLLAGGSLAAGILAAGGGAFLAPSAAQAANECAVIGVDPADNGAAADTFNCAGSYTGSGITYASRGALTVNSTGSMNVGTVGVNLTGAGSDSVAFTATGTVTGTGGPAIEVTSGSGAITVSTAGVTANSGTASHGIKAVSTSGAINVTTTGTVNSSTPASALSAIHAVTGGTGAISITTTGTVTGRERGIEARTTGTGALTITASTININNAQGVANIDARTGTGLLTVTTTGALNGQTGNAIRTDAGGDAVVNLTGANATVTAAASSTEVLNLRAVGATTLTNGVTISAAANQAAIRASGGAFNFTNDGTLTGRIDLTGVTGKSVITNNGNRTWTIEAASDFGPGQAELNNAGKLVARGNAAAFNRLETLENSGRIIFGEFRFTVGETLTARNVAYKGAGGQLEMDVMLGVAGQAGCATATVADCLDLRGGSTEGVTTILINPLGPITNEANTDGIVLVDVGGGTSRAGDFIIDRISPNYDADAVYGAVITTDGLLAFALQYDEAAQVHYLGSVVPSQRLEYIGALQETLSVWHTTSDTVAGRQASLQNGGERGFWVRVGGERSTRDIGLDFTAQGADFRYDDTYELNTTVALAGLDLLAGDSGGKSYVFGVHGGVVRSQLERDSTPAADQMDGVAFGLYGGWWGEGLTLDGALNVNVLNLEHDRPADELSTTEVISAGVRVEAGWRMAMSEGFYIQPLATLAYVGIDIEDVIQTSFDASYEDVSSLRGAVGLRLGGGQGGLGYWLEGRVWNEFSGDGTLQLRVPIEDVLIQDDMGGGFQELGLGLSLTSADDLRQGFLAAGATFGDNADSYSLSLGARLRW